MGDKPTRRRSLGGSRSNPTLQAASAAEELRNIQGFIDKDEREIVHVTPSEIKKTFNARFIPCPLDEFSKIQWPDLSLSVDEARELYPNLLSGREFWETLSSLEQADFIDFLGGVHSTASSMVNELQIHPITLERESPESNEFFIVDGERRSLSALYSRGKIPVVKAYVYNRFLEPLEKALLKDSANTGVPLMPHENLVSKYEIYKAYPDAESLNVRDLGQLLGFNKNIGSILKRIFVSPERGALFERARKEKLGWREIDYLSKNGANAELPDGETGEGNGSKEKEEQGLSHGGTRELSRKSRDIVSLEEKIAQHVGYPCTIGFNQGSGKVKVSFAASSLDDFENLLANLKRLDLEKVLDR